MTTPLYPVDFQDPGAQIVWGALCTLDEGALHDVLAALQVRIARPETRTTPTDVRVAAAVAALREAAAELAHSPSVSEYRGLRADNPTWPPDSSVRRVLGGGWNNALQRAHLDAVPDDDVVIALQRSRFTSEQVLRAINDCVAELGTLPTFHDYVGWARRPDVLRRPGTRPRSQPVFDRLFGGWYDALAAAGHVSSSDGIVTVADGAHSRRLRYRFTDEELTTALVDMAGLIGRPPRSTEIGRLRERLMAQARVDGTNRVVPSLHAYQRAFHTWDDAVRAAGLDRRPRSGYRSTGPLRTERRRTSDQEIASAMRDARSALGRPFTTQRYNEWVRQQRAANAEAGIPRRIPSLSTILTRYGTWFDAWVATLTNSSRRRAT